MSHGIVEYKGASAEGIGGPSPRIWADCPWAQAQIDPGIGFGFWDDFLTGQLTPTITTIIDVNNYLMFGSANATVTYDGAVGGGIILTEATDDEAVSITTKQLPYQLTSLGGDFWFEAKIKSSTITANKQAWCVGLMDSTPQTATIPLTATGAIGDINFVGFHHPEANTTLFDASYKANTVTLVEVNADAGTLAADTYIKLGMKVKAGVLSFFVDGVQLGSTKTLPNANGTDFPADVTLAPVLAQVLAASNSATLTMDWWRGFQRRVA